MATPRHKLVDEEHAACYHVTSRCVRRAWLCGYDPFTRRNYSYRRRWLVERMKRLARCFAVEIFGYAVMSNHFHLVLRYDPKACESWTDEEVARRWFEAFPPREDGRPSEQRDAEARELLMDDPERLARARRTLGSLSHFMKHLKQPIARRANLEDGCEGHFFEQRFYSGALLSEEALLAAMVYVDLNPVRAGEVRELIDCRDTSIGERLQEHSEAALEEYLAPVASGLEGSTNEAAAPLNITLRAYIQLLLDMIAAETGTSDRPDRVARWAAWVTSLRKRQRAYGSKEQLQSWTAARAMRLRETPLPA
ncbi:MAG: transposase [Gammaproteobacteria bacterium]|nr:transposase [Gammaproteobacteria bacterium]